MENDEAELRIIDEDLLEEGIERRAQLLDEFLAERLRTYKADLLDTHQREISSSGQSAAEEFGNLLAKVTKDMLDYERAHKVITNWNRSEEEQDVCRRTATLGKDYFLASQAERTKVVTKCLNFFSHLPMPLEELAYEERAVRSGTWAENTPIEERHIWVKIAKGGHRITMETGPRSAPRAHPAAAEPEQNPPRTPARKRFAEIRRSKSRR